MRPLLGIIAGVALLTAVGAAPAKAELLNFDLTGSREASFQLDSNPTPSSFSDFGALGGQTFFTAVSGTYGGVAGTADINFGLGPIFADLNIGSNSLGFTQFSGPTIFSGTTDAPVFSVGSFNLTSIVSGSSTLTISEATSVSAAPEPGTWALMMLGVGMMGAMLGYRKRVLVEHKVKFAAIA